MVTTGGSQWCLPATHTGGGLTTPTILELLDVEALSDWGSAMFKPALYFEPVVYGGSEPTK